MTIWYNNDSLAYTVQNYRGHQCVAIDSEKGENITPISLNCKKI